MKQSSKIQAIAIWMIGALDHTKVNQSLIYSAMSLFKILFWSMTFIIQLHVF